MSYEEGLLFGSCLSLSMVSCESLSCISFSSFWIRGSDSSILNLECSGGEKKVSCCFKETHSKYPRASKCYALGQRKSLLIILCHKVGFHIDLIGKRDNARLTFNGSKIPG